ncbi:HD domain-containing protein [Nocardia puris]|uniref:HD domain-containing protein n=1 Tax=Nocardia puris TaxID=208602 RepID=A0A366DMV6_9NOCA|nr:HD domain-containing protein [Nocardia puris]MBF6213459.1 HD domain-containing protein [Nocardia puris]MBF6365611.1 HD domain-containing protein [Nocardia puris]MBF6460077.1 HD domain-containing protein [Nocardia puris]RBO91437.1 HD domain-containing protein [Nocardia puris]
MGAPTGFDWEWAERTGGKLTGAQRRQLTAKLAATLPGVVADRVRLALGKRGAGHVDLDAAPPDSKLSRATEEEARECLSPYVLEHSYRTYYFGRALAELSGTSYDDELAYVSCLLHDLTLETPSPGACFAVDGAERAKAFVTAHGASEHQAHLVGAAIAAHLTPGVADDLDTVGIVSAGAAADVLGLRLADLDPVWVDQLLTRHPRADFKRRVRAAFDAQAAAAPNTRIHWMMNTARFGPLIRFAPFDE